MQQGREAGLEAGCWAGLRLGGFQSGAASWRLLRCLGRPCEAALPAPRQAAGMKPLGTGACSSAVDPAGARLPTCWSSVAMLASRDDQLAILGGSLNKT